MDKRKLLTIPIEIYQREFDLALYLALVATEKGFQVLLGSHKEKIFKKTKNGIYYHKDHANWSEPLYRSAIRRGMKTAALDVEGLIYNTPEVYMNIRANKWTLENINLVFAWGEKQLKMIKKKSDNYKNIILVGSPKFDICELAKRNKSKAAFNYKAKSILVNTRFPSINEHVPDRNINLLQEMGVLKTDKQIKEYEASLKADEVIYEEFIKFIKLFAVNKKNKITIRPHPAENDKFYKKLALKYQNIHIDRETDLVSQILNHDCVIHDGCTTAIETRALGKPVFGLRPSNLEIAYNDYANNYSLNFTSAINLYDYVNENNISNYEMPNSRNLALKSIHNWEGVNGSATYKIVDEFDKLKIPVQKIIKFPWFERFDSRDFLYKLSMNSSFLHRCFNLIWSDKFNEFIYSSKINSEKFGKLDLNQVHNKVKYYNRLDENNTTKLDDLSIVQVSGKSILLYKKSYSQIPNKL